MPTSTTPVRSGTAAVITTVATVCPVFIVGGLSVQIIQELRFSPAGLGLVVAAYFTASALASFSSGQLVERLGPNTVGRAAIVLSSASMLAIALWAHDLTTLTILLVAAGPANSLGQLAANSLLAHHVPPHRKGLMFGIKQASVPLSTTLAGLAVPTVALTIGWRWGFGLAAALVLLALIAIPSGRGVATSSRKRTGKPSTALVVITIASGLGATAANPLGSFVADFVVTRGMSETMAGFTVTAGGIAGLVSRISVGWIADQRSGGRLTMVAIMLASGAVGLGAFLLPMNWVVPIATAAGFALGWAWPGLLNFAITLRHPHAPAAATGVTQTGVYLGGGVGPLSFGALVHVWNYDVAWAVMAVLMLISAGVMMVGRRMLLQVT